MLARLAPRWRSGSSPMAATLTSTASTRAPTMARSSAACGWRHMYASDTRPRRAQTCHAAARPGSRLASCAQAPLFNMLAPSTPASPSPALLEYRAVGKLACTGRSAAGPEEGPGGCSYGALQARAHMLHARALVVGRDCAAGHGLDARVALLRPGQQLQQVLHLIVLRRRVGQPLHAAVSISERPRAGFLE